MYSNRRAQFMSRPRMTRAKKGKASARRAPRKGYSRARREAEILDAAFSEFAANGYAATRLEDVARRAGVAKGLPSFYFERKEDLFRAVIRRVLLPLWIDLSEAVSPVDGSTRDLLRATLSAMYRGLVANERAREAMRLLIAEGPRFPELTEYYYSEVVERNIAIWHRLVSRGISRGEFREGPVARYPHIVFGPALQASIWQLLFGHRHGLDLESWIESHVDLVLNGLDRIE